MSRLALVALLVVTAVPASARVESRRVPLTGAEPDPVGTGAWQKRAEKSG